MYEIIAPPAHSRLTLSPLVETIAPGSSARVEVTFSPTDADCSPDEPTPDVPAAVGAVVVSQSAVPVEPWSKHDRWTVPCFMKLDGVSGADAGTGIACMAVRVDYHALH